MKKIFSLLMISMMALSLSAKTIYLNTGGANLWNQADAVFFTHSWGDGDSDQLMTLVEGDVFSAVVPDTHTSIVFVRMAPGSEAINWDTKWNQSVDQTIPADKDCFTMTSWDNGVWSVYGEEPQPVETNYYLVGTMNEWNASDEYKFAANAETEGEFMLETILAEGDSLKVMGVTGEITSWYPTGDNYVVDAAHAGSVTMYFQVEYKAEWAEFGGYFYIAVNPAPVADPYAEITFANVISKDALPEDSVFTIEDSEFALTIHDAGNKMEIDSNACRFGNAEAYNMYRLRLKSGGASGSDKNYFTLNIPEAGKLRIAPRTSSSSATDRALVIIQGEDTLYNDIVMDAQAIEVQEGENTVKVFPYVEVAVAAGSVLVRYTGGLNFYAFAFKAEGEEPQPIVEVPVVKLAGSLTSWEEPVLMVNSEDNLTATLKLNLGIDHYQLKVVSDGNWLTKAGENDLYTIHREWDHADHLDLINVDENNIKLITDMEGEYIFTWSYADSTLVVTFPEVEPVTYRLENGYYLMGLDMQDWTVEYLTADRLFVANPEVEGEYMITVTLAADQQFKAVSVENDAIITWYPDGMDNNYVVPAELAGQQTIFFRPDGQGGEGWHEGYLYIAEPQGLEQTAATMDMMKMIEKGQLIIIKNGVRYNAQGAVVR